ncbi:hypothetical protein Pmar_PMAR000632, partial [Perkinsus marinus ATCC 50983]
DLAQERTASSALTNRIHELEAREAELVRQLEEQKSLCKVSRAEVERRAAEVDQLVEERQALVARIEDIEATAGSAAAQGVIGSPTQMSIVQRSEQSLVAGRGDSDLSRSRVTPGTLAFYPNNLSSYLTLSLDGMRVEYDCDTAAKDEAMCGVVMTDRPLPYDTSFG